MGQSTQDLQLLLSSPRPSLLLFAGSIATNPARRGWIQAMQNEPTCQTILFSSSSRKKFSSADIEDALLKATFCLQMRGHVGPRKSIFDAMRCLSMPLMASDRSPLPLPREVEYAAFGLRVPENANVSAVLGALRRFDQEALTRMRAAMAQAVYTLDYGPQGGLAAAVLRNFGRVATGEVRAIPATTKTPLALLKTV